MRIMITGDGKRTLKASYACVRAVLPQAQIYLYTTEQARIAEAEGTGILPDIALIDAAQPRGALALAEKLRGRAKNLNLIFLCEKETGAPFLEAAFGLFASGCMRRPLRGEDFLRQLRNLRYPPTPQQGLYLRCFGEAQLLRDGAAVSFALTKSFELFCYLAAKLGAGASKKELCEVLFADASYSRRTQDYFSKAVAALKKTLKELGAAELFLHGRDFYAVRTELLQCDAYECLRGEPALQKIEPEYFMTQYGWAQKSALMQELMQ